MNLQQLEDLERRLKEATGPDRELDSALDALSNGEFFEFEGNKVYIWGATVKDFAFSRGDREHKWLRGRPSECSTFTASIDAALSLVKWMFPGAAYILNGFRVATKPTDVWAYKCHLSDDCSGLGDGPTQALAILLALVAALKARLIHSEPSQPVDSDSSVTPKLS